MQWLRRWLIAVMFLPVVSHLSAQQVVLGNWQLPFAVTSDTFRDGATLPLSMIYNSVSNGVNACTADGSAGGNASPQLTWTPYPGARTYAVVLFDETANFTHWGLYNLPPTTISLPADAGIANNNYGPQITNDFGNAEYDGPCPPPGLVHKYVFTVYAVDKKLDLPQSQTFPANAETLFRSLIGHVLAKTSIAGYYSTTPQQ
ncbi:MAG TPA: YbhB/YbcL family Raf kinase inhibitor-like protein [Pseudacidobacterium sp.]|nr:YbhB/YbcL family Raf kinase inhibitor-like protein [Pseudacidobacterium sp.]